MRGRGLLGAAVLALALAPGAAHAVDPLGPWPGSVPRPAPILRPTPARPGDAAHQGLDRLRAQDQKNRLEDLRTGTQRQREADLLRNDPLALERARQRWRAQDRQTELQRERERQAIEQRVRTEEHLESTGQPSVAAPPTESREEFDRELRDQRERERIESLRRGVGPSRGPGVPTGPGVQRWPR